MPIEVAPTCNAPSPEIVGEGTGVSRETTVKSKILSHFIKGKISLSPMETLLMILGELEHLESLVKLARRKKDAETMADHVSVVSSVPAIRRIYVNKTNRSKTLHLPVEINRDKRGSVAVNYGESVAECELGETMEPDAAVILESASSEILKVDLEKMSLCDHVATEQTNAQVSNSNTDADDECGGRL
ncbi:unnamed protein product [Sphagnum jensenii]|uniref:Uncharacterized protein n=1 Tax=Sphagnum jensenii TaxID=128206 RepID=A0ABP1BMP9_9BRYO